MDVVHGNGVHHVWLAVQGWAEGVGVGGGLMGDSLGLSEGEKVYFWRKELMDDKQLCPFKFCFSYSFYISRKKKNNSVRLIFIKQSTFITRKHTRLYTVKTLI